MEPLGRLLFPGDLLPGRAAEETQAPGRGEVGALCVLSGARTERPSGEPCRARPVHPGTFAAPCWFSLADCPAAGAGVFILLCEHRVGTAPRPSPRPHGAAWE